MFDQSQFGGFGGESPAKQQGGGGKGGKREACLPATCSMLNGTLINEDKVLVGAKEFSSVKILAEVDTITSRTGTVIDFTIKDDSSDNDKENRVSVRLFIAGDDEGGVADVIEGSFVNVDGRIRSFDGKKVVTAFHVEPVENQKELEAHALECKLARLYYEKDIPGKLETGADLGLDGTMCGRDAGKPGTSTQGQQGGMFGQPGGNNTFGNANQGAGGGDIPMYNSSGLTGVNAQVAALVKSMDNQSSDVGVHVNQIQQALPAIKKELISQALEYLSSEGHVYSTVDDDHFKTVDCYTAGGALLLRLWEKWSFFDAFYFCFVTVTTIGFGDIVPQNESWILLTLLYIICGLIITTMCIDLVGSAYIRDIHFYGRTLGNTFMSFGGKVVHLGEVFGYVAFLQRNYGITPEQLEKLANLPDNYLLECLIQGRQPDLTLLNLRPFVPFDIYYFKWIEQPRTLSFVSEKILASMESLEYQTNSRATSARTLTPREYYQHILMQYCKDNQEQGVGQAAPSGSQGTANAGMGHPGLSSLQGLPAALTAAGGGTAATMGLGLSGLQPPITMDNTSL